ncbi:acyl-CoA reductase-like NAD-dependent aldehyde dehydrogenase [Rhodovulum imhoffii]|uniref:Acyl-CoA reductase-like NAD-dependent aldehyde dehydrogenase n=1 Tax=Rhodovulum imhoffii TaxID=365340 RepID=A0A2T5BUJ6_9RHOB|nr:aldehyde dehydrogenase family protein [Rhodovulum imhoffii]MBK5932394.1 sorbosone dehydrogenase [Rhodovulum imhoffii]PTN03167.1 acyl-CoA reductase-like NAD-dependent aldehyde dehydrogenase [Rhodovulum imhoffii]
MDKSSNRLSLPASPREFGFYVNGACIPIGSREVFSRNSPGHDVPVTRIPKCTTDDLDMAVDAARAAFDDRRWSGLNGQARAAVLLRTGALIRERSEEIAYFETLENGKPISQARAEVAGCADMFEYASGLARSLHGDSFNNLGDGMFGLVTREPVGVVGIITPWNFPFLILCERVPYILASGCTIVAKPSEVTSATTLILAQILTEAGLPDGCMNVVTGSGSTIGQALIEHPHVDMLSFTGSTAVGRRVVEAAGRTNFKKLGLELGGKNPQIVFADADLEDAADGVAFGIGFNTGQCCVSGSRLVVERSVADAFAQKIQDKFARVVVGDPLNEATQIGAITTDAQNRTIMSYIEKGKAEGAKLICGGEQMDFGRGQYISPTLFGDVTSEMAIAREEIFGPVLAIMPFDSVEEAIMIANDTEYGLAASVWTKNIDKALMVTRRVQAGRFWINTTLSGGPELPLGGFRQSGWGREAGMYGVEEYTQIKSVHIEIGKRTPWIA